MARRRQPRRARNGNPIVFLGHGKLEAASREGGGESAQHPVLGPTLGKANVRHRHPGFTEKGSDIPKERLSRERGRDLLAVVGIEKDEVVPPVVVGSRVRDELPRILCEHTKPTPLAEVEMVASDLHDDRIDLDHVDRRLRELRLQETRIRAPAEADEQDAIETLGQDRSDRRDAQVDRREIARPSAVDDRLIDSAHPTEAEVSVATVVDHEELAERALRPVHDGSRRARRSIVLIAHLLGLPSNAPGRSPGPIHVERSISMVRALRLLLVLTLSGSSARAAAEAPFERRDLRTQHAIVQDPVAVRFGSGGARHLLVVTSPDRKRVFAELFALDDGGAPGPKPVWLDLPSDVVAFDVAEIDAEGREALFFLTPRAILRFDPASGALREERRVESVYRRPVPGRLLPIDFMRDQSDGDAPLVVVPDFDGLRAGTSVLPITPRTHHQEGGTSYHPEDVHLADLDLDGTDDLYLIADDSLHVFAGKDAGFSTTPSQRPLGLDVAPDLPPEQLGDRDQSEVTTRKVIVIDDFDDDGLVDLLVESTRRSGVLERETTHELHQGRKGPSGVTYSGESLTTIKGDAPLGGVRTADIDGDGRLDLAAGSIDIGIGTIVSALLTGSVDFDVRFFRLTEDGYPEDPNHVHEARIEFDLSKGSASIPVLVLADVDGDGDQDLIVREDPDELLVFPANGSAELFDDDSRSMSIPLPENGQLIRRATLNGDSADDLIVRYEGLAGEEARRTVSLLLGRPSAEATTD